MTTAKKKRKKPKRPASRIWSEKELATMRRLWPCYPDRLIMYLLGRSQSCVHNQAKRMGLKRTPEYLAAQKARATLRIQTDRVMREHIFQPGLVPWNAGRKGYKPGGRVAETQFKRGCKPKTTQPIGAHRIVNNKSGGPLLERKMTETPGPNNLRWVPVARLVWEAAHGPVPPGHIVVFKNPGLRTVVLEQITLDKLDCITRAEHARRNHPRNKHPELGRLIQLKGAITRQVNRIAKAAAAEKAASATHTHQPNHPNHPTP